MKSTNKILIPALLFAVLIACSSGANTPCEPEVAANEYAVYSAAIGEFSRGRNGKSVVIFDHTEDVSDPSTSASKWVRRCEAFIPETEKAMVENYRESNRQPLELARAFMLEGEYVLASDADLKAIPNDRMRLEGMRAKYPDAFGVVGLSRVGFDAGMNKALVYISQGYCGLGCGEGVCMLLVREDCKWKVKNKGGVWMS